MTIWELGATGRGSRAHWVKARGRAVGLWVPARTVPRDLLLFTALPLLGHAPHQDTRARLLYSNSYMILTCYRFHWKLQVIVGFLRALSVAHIIGECHRRSSAHCFPSSAVNSRKYTALMTSRCLDMILGYPCDAMTSCTLEPQPSAPSNPASRKQRVPARTVRAPARTVGSGFRV